MTVKVAGLWELGYSAPLTEWAVWYYPLQDFGVDEWMMSPITGVSATQEVKEYVDIPAAIGANPDLTVVYVDESGVTDLEDFVHPENALYVFGKASLSPMRAYGSESDLSVKITTKEQKAFLWPHQCAVMVLYDRMKKLG